MSVQRISIDTPLATNSVKAQLPPMQNTREFLVALSNYISSIAGGVKRAKVRVNVGAVQAAGTVAFSSLIADDTVTVNGIVFTAKASPSGANQFALGASDEAAANNFATKINASALDLIVGVMAAGRRGTIILSSFADADTVTINGVVFTGKTTPDTSVPEQFKIGGTDAKTAENLLLAIPKSSKPGLAGLTVSRSTATLTFNYNGSLTLAASAHATVSDKIIVMTSLVGGQIGNLCSLAISAHGSVSGAVLTGGTEGTEVIFNKNYTTL